jgi:hypothetical protein
VDVAGEMPQVVINMFGGKLSFGEAKYMQEVRGKIIEQEGSIYGVIDKKKKNKQEEREIHTRRRRQRVRWFMEKDTGMDACLYVLAGGHD